MDQTDDIEAFGTNYGANNNTHNNNNNNNYNTMNNDDDFDHSESDEGINQEKPNFDGNEFNFRKRHVGETSAEKPQANHGFKTKLGSSNGFAANEDLEAQHIGSQFRGKKSTNKKPQDDDLELFGARGRGSMNGNSGTRNGSNRRVESISDNGSDIEMGNIRRRMPDEANANKSNRKPPMGNQNRAFNARDAFYGHDEEEKVPLQ